MLTADLKSVQCGFESHRPYYRKAQRCRKNADEKRGARTLLSFSTPVCTLVYSLGEWLGVLSRQGAGSSLLLFSIRYSSLIILPFVPCDRAPDSP
jgi:hypothetical protein